MYLIGHNIGPGKPVYAVFRIVFSNFASFVGYLLLIEIDNISNLYHIEKYIDQRTLTSLPRFQFHCFHLCSAGFHGTRPQRLLPW